MLTRPAETKPVSPDMFQETSLIRQAGPTGTFLATDGASEESPFPGVQQKPKMDGDLKSGPGPS